MKHFPLKKQRFSSGDILLCLVIHDMNRKYISGILVQTTHNGDDIEWPILQLSPNFSCYIVLLLKIQKARYIIFCGKMIEGEGSNTLYQSFIVFLLHAV